MRADLQHAGAEHDETNRQFHFYLDTYMHRACDRGESDNENPGGKNIYMAKSRSKSSGGLPGKKRGPVSRMHRYKYPFDYNK